MASIRIPFPEKDEPGIIRLQGARVTVGRLPFNTLQIIDRTVSGFHAELILEDGHYRLHDRGSTNGTFVNAEPATDFHLRDACKISFGTVECDFDPADETVGLGDSVPTREEINNVRQENAALRGTLAMVREEVATLRGAKSAEPSADAVARVEFTKVVAEREALKEAQLRQEQEIARLKGEVAVLRRDRENLQKAWDATKAELTKIQRPFEAVALVKMPAPASPPPPPVGEPQPPVRPAAMTVVPPIPAAPQSFPAVPVAKPTVPVAAPTTRTYPSAPRPAGPPPKLVPGAVAAAQNSSGVRPFPRVVPPAASVPPPAGAIPKAVPGTPHPRPSVLPVHPPAPGPKGTQKIG